MRTPGRSIVGKAAGSNACDIDLNEKEELRLLAQMGWTPSEDSEGEAFEVLEAEAASVRLDSILSRLVVSDREDEPHRCSSPAPGAVESTTGAAADLQGKRKRKKKKEKGRPADEVPQASTTSAPTDIAPESNAGVEAEVTEASVTPPAPEEAPGCNSSCNARCVGNEASPREADAAVCEAEGTVHTLQTRPPRLPKLAVNGDKGKSDRGEGGDVYVVNKDFEEENLKYYDGASVEMSVRIGENVRVEQFDVEWWYCCKLDRSGNSTGQRGWVPECFLSVPAEYASANRMKLRDKIRKRAQLRCGYAR
eukprot:TRINITY_DN42657_c0_g1_i1.p1 TRINITY_DN42657_c0_g1~~TRINITY_DN42657_c0_g1_i1.p1  ORF type:complete len:308 (+),score=69.36 TRINITY_DN42657_c0_g1_i1:131-1054(+)